MTEARLSFVALSVADLDKSLEFYRHLLGLPLVNSNHDSDLKDPWYGGANWVSRLGF